MSDDLETESDKTESVETETDYVHYFLGTHAHTCERQSLSFCVYTPTHLYICLYFHSDTV